jgi:uncharacterized protein
VIYLDSSVALGQLFAEDRALPQAVTEQPLVSSRLLEYEVWNRIHARGFTHSHSEEVEALLARVILIDFSPAVLARAREPFPVSVRTLDGLHLATIEFLRARGENVELASYDRRLIAGARALGIAVYAL